jgi:hypothetical protein
MNECNHENAEWCEVQRGNPESKEAWVCTDCGGIFDHSYPAYPIVTISV